MEQEQKTVEDLLGEWVRDQFARLFPDTDWSQHAIGMKPTADPAHGDYQCDAAMKLAKLLKKPPRAIAETIAQEAERIPAVASIAVAGPGFLNVTLDGAWLQQMLDAMQRDARLAVPTPGSGRTVILDYSSPNIAKPMHIGHIRSTVIGNALDRIYRFLGYRVISDNHFGDWGTQFGLLIIGYKHFADAKALEEQPIEELERIYRESFAKSEADETWRNQARQELVALQQGSAENLALWQRFIELSKREFDRIYRRLDVRFDLERGESHYNNRLSGVIQQLQQQGLAEESEGALVVRLDDEKLPLSMVRKSDGGFNYTTTDLATVMARLEEFKPERIVYVTDERQQLHFRQFFAIARRMGWHADLVHVWFGLMRLPEGTFSTRQGNVIKLERLLDEAETRALAIVQQASPDMPADRQREVARAVGIGAVKYADLSQNPQSLVTFTWDKALALEGNSAPYLQYAYARIASVIDKYRERYPGQDFMAAPISLQEPIERELGLRLARFANTLVGAAGNYRPNYLADYLYSLAQTYSAFYQNVPFLKAEPGIRESRVRLCALVAQVLRQGLALLGIETPERI